MKTALLAVLFSVAVVSNVSADQDLAKEKRALLSQRRQLQQAMQAVDLRQAEIQGVEKYIARQKADSPKVQTDTFEFEQDAVVEFGIGISIPFEFKQDTVIEFGRQINILGQKIPIRITLPAGTKIYYEGKGSR